ncbi:hypothetical protein BDM02DRAFT_3186366 [Thelephora ganbajun]|uniref:Uncharacterized protein n=1 Tax=Thelephora ganbajun TaxID=370292 RepID=A0ACB6ZIC6_THEGA|nr:hypothetical protein BDM02DRAFT_3186366 [Thelephora ganbajun]
MVSIDPSPVLLKDATLEQIVQAISARIEEKDLNYTEEELAAASKNIKTAISHINYAWNLQHSPIFRLPDHLILRIFEHLQGLAHETPSKTHQKWWEWLKVMSVCRAWWRISLEGSSLWENVHILYKMPVSFLGLILDRTEGTQLALHFRSCDYLHSRIRRDGYLRAIEPIADRIKGFTIHITASAWHLERGHLPNLFLIPYPNLESLDLSYNAFHAASGHAQSQPLYRPDISDILGAVVLHLITFIPTDQLKHLTLRHTKGWPPTRFGNLTNLTLSGYADGTALAEAIPSNPALQKLKLESIKYEERYSYDPDRLVKLDGQTLELARCNPGVLSMFTLSSTCSLIITRTMGRYAPTYAGEVPELRWLPKDISEFRCLHELEEVHFSVTIVPGRRSWITAEQKTVGYSASNSSSAPGPGPSVTFALTYHYHAMTPLCRVPFEPRYLLPHPTPWGKVTRASFDGFNYEFSILDNVVFKALQNLRSLVLRRSSSSLVLFITPNELRGLESLRFEDEVELGDVLSKVLERRRTSAGLRLKDLTVVTSGDPSSVITLEHMGRLEECASRIEVTRAPGYSPGVTVE